MDSHTILDKTVPQIIPSAAADSEAFAALSKSVYAALETYSNVHRGSGHNSLVSTRLYEQAREIVLEYLGLSKDTHAVIFCTPRRAQLLQARLAPGRYRCISSQEIGLPLGIHALVVERRALPRGVPFQTGGGTARLVSPDWVIWAKAPDKFEAGTPAIVNVVAFAAALRLTRRFGPGAFQAAPTAERPAAEILYHDDLENFSGRGLLDALRQTLIGRDVRVPTVAGDRPFINLDNAASTPTFQPVWQAVCQAWRQSGPVQQEIVQEVRSICAAVLDAPSAAYDLVFTANTTEAINLAAESLGRETEPGVEPVVLNTFIEHNSNELPWRSLPGVSLIRLEVDAEGFMDLTELETLLRAYNQAGQHGQQRIRLVAVSGASNVLGTFNDLAEIGRIVHSYGARLLVDAAQMVAHRQVAVQTWGVDYLAFSAHKVYAPFGTGVLLARKGLLRFSPSEMQRIQASGEENVAGIAALGKALVLLRRIGLDGIAVEERALTARALRGLAHIPGLKVYGVEDPESPRFAQKGGVIAFSVKDVLPSRVAQALATRGGIGVRSGCHCAHLLIKRLLNISPFLARFQGWVLTLFPSLALPGVVRVSLGIENRPEDVDAFLQGIEEIARRPQSGAGRRTPSARNAASNPSLLDDFIQDRARRVYPHP